MSGAVDIDLARRCVVFMGNPLDISHGERVASLLGSFSVDAVRGSVSAWCRLGRHAESVWGVSTEPFDLMGHELCRYVLLEAGEVERISDWLGALSYVDVLRRVMDGGVMRRLREEAGHCYPGVLRQSGYFSRWLPSLGGCAEAVETRSLSGLVLRRHGLRVYESLLRQGLPSWVCERWRLKFSPSLLEGIEPLGGLRLGVDAGVELLEALINRG